MGFGLVQDTSDGDEGWLEVRTPDERLILVLSPRQGDPPSEGGPPKEMETR
jgi:hypothetical protein